MEKHTIQDGPIPLSGLSPLVVCRQWGYNNGTNFSSGEKEISISFPITFLTMAVTASAVHHKYASKSSNDLIEIKSLSTDSMKLSIRDAKDVNTPVSTYCYWFAIGI